ncbi:hypothetical protein [Oceanivirga salmonicida]|uniref:hypothetical protein n=1 Tax=Oceanivirga salmonicida TaxID=1769291 RepID=UPI0012E12C80|nr:hypothetical protein [Oceanivirga salmonicida]
MLTAITIFALEIVFGIFFAIMAFIIQNITITGIVGIIILIIFYVIFMIRLLKLKFSAFSKVKKPDLEKFSDYMWKKNKNVYYLIILVFIILYAIQMVYGIYVVLDIFLDISKDIDFFPSEILNLDTTNPANMELIIQEAGNKFIKLYYSMFKIKILILYIPSIIYSYINYCVNVDIYGSYLEFEKEKNIEITK